MFERWKQNEATAGLVGIFEGSGGDVNSVSESGGGCGDGGTDATAATSDGQDSCDCHAPHIDMVGLVCGRLIDLTGARVGVFFVLFGFVLICFDLF